jgi:hypothetical protein
MDIRCRAGSQLLCADEAEAEFGAIRDKYHVVAGEEVVLASVGRGQAHVDTLVDTAEDTMSDDIFHVKHNTPTGGG